MATNGHSTDAAIFSTFEQYRAAHRAYDALPPEVLDLPTEEIQKLPEYVAWDAASSAMDAAPMPETLAGALVHLRYTLGTNSETHEEESALLHASVPDLAQFVRDRFATQNSQCRGSWAALGVIASDEAMAGTDEAFQGGRQHALREMALAWIDRWKALGGHFTYTQWDNGEPRMGRSMVVDLDYWFATDEGNPKLPPHAWLIKEERHSGAVKVLEGMLELVSDLKAAIAAVARELYPTPVSAGGK